jgi:hypothetical protein
MKYKFTVKVVKWFDKLNGNTYHNVRITDNLTGKEYLTKYGYTYGYGTAYEQTTLEVLLENKLLPKKYTKENLYLYERENNYPILYDVTEGKKKDMINI